MIRYQVILRFDLDPLDDPPSQWDWNRLLFFQGVEVEVVDSRVVREDGTPTWSPPLPSEQCPAGGPHRWVTETPADYYVVTGSRRSTPQQRTHCDECGASPPEEVNDGY